jgi:4-hydroxybenzoate polyprenyltransferase
MNNVTSSALASTLPGQAPPLVVDLDGTLLKSDMLFELGMAFVRQHPLRVWEPLRWLGQGKVALKEGLTNACEFDVTVLPFDEAVLELIDEARQQGRQVVLATASSQQIADDIGTHLGVFDQVLATGGGINLSAHRKRDRLVELYGEKGFDYVGNSHDDLVVWASARHAYLANPDSGVEAKAAKQCSIKQVIRSNPIGVRPWVKAFRLHQWMKNILVFVPLLAAHQITSMNLWLAGLLAFLLFGLCASSVYILNDLLDLTDDRHHKTKRNRPFASGKVKIKHGIFVFPLLLVGSFATAALLLPWAFSIALVLYYVITLTYSFALKRMMALDVITLALLYTMRIIAGTAALGLELTFWLLAFSMFIFLSLALVKRYAELHDARLKGKSGKTRGRGYYPSDLEMLSSLGAASGYLSVMVMALYIHDGTTAMMYTHPQIIWLACPLLLLWITRVWMLTHRGEMHDDPVVFAIKDKPSLLIGLLFCLAFWAAA